MVNSRRAVLVALIISMALLSACALAPTAPDETQRQGALQRWNQCLERYNANLEHYCDGHRRDILTTYPHHHQFQINRELVQRARAISKARSIKTAVEGAPVKK